MMRNFLIILIVAPFLFAFTRGDWGTELEMMRCTHYETDRVSATSTNTKLSYDRDVKAIYLENEDSTNEAWIDLDDGVATAGSGNEIRLDAGENRSIAGFMTNTIGIITSAGKTAEVNVEVCW